MVSKESPISDDCSHLEEHDVDGSREEDRPDGDEDCDRVRKIRAVNWIKLADLHDEPSMSPWVLPENDSSSVTQYLISAAKDHCCHETPGSVMPTEDSLNNHADGIKANECTTGSNRGTVTVDA